MHAWVGKVVLTLGSNRHKRFSTKVAPNFAFKTVFRHDTTMINISFSYNLKAKFLSNINWFARRGWRVVSEERGHECLVDGVWSTVVLFGSGYERCLCKQSAETDEQKGDWGSRRAVADLSRCGGIMGFLEQMPSQRWSVEWAFLKDLLTENGSGYSSLSSIFAQNFATAALFRNCMDRMIVL